MCTLQLLPAASNLDALAAACDVLREPGALRAALITLLAPEENRVLDAAHVMREVATLAEPTLLSANQEAQTAVCDVCSRKPAFAAYQVGCRQRWICETGAVAVF
jgi:hypothetical protein